MPEALSAPLLTMLTLPVLKLFTEMAELPESIRPLFWMVMLPPLLVLLMPEELPDDTLPLFTIRVSPETPLL